MTDVEPVQTPLLAIGRQTAALICAFSLLTLLSSILLTGLLNFESFGKASSNDTSTQHHLAVSAVFFWGTMNALTAAGVLLMRPTSVPQAAYTHQFLAQMIIGPVCFILVVSTSCALTVILIRSDDPGTDDSNFAAHTLYVSIIFETCLLGLITLVNKCSLTGHLAYYYSIVFLIYFASLLLIVTLTAIYCTAVTGKYVLFGTLFIEFSLIALLEYRRIASAISINRVNTTAYTVLSTTEDV